MRLPLFSLLTVRFKVTVLALLVLLPRITLAQWTDVTPGIFPGDGSGLNWIDYDNDGDLDIFITSGGCPPVCGNVLFRNDGGNIFTQITGGLLTDPSWGGHWARWADYDNDGDLDVFVPADPSRLFRNEGGGNFVDASTSLLRVPAVGVGWADYDLDGDADFYVISRLGVNRLFRNEGNDDFVDATVGPLATSADLHYAAWGDYDNDGDADLYLVGDGWPPSPNKLLRNDGGTFVDVTTGALGDASSGRVAVWVDYDNDRDLDLHIANYVGSSKLLRNDGDGFVDVTPISLSGGDIHGAVWGDYDNDGDLDVYIVVASSPNKLLRNDGMGVFTDITGGGLALGSVSISAGWGDYDNDGDLDLCVVGSHGAKVFRNDQASGNHWLQVDVVGKRSNASSIGARVRAVAGTLRQIREVVSDFNSLTVEFGLGAAASVDTLEIRWPSGISKRLVQVPADRRITVVESSTRCDAKTVFNPGERRRLKFSISNYRPSPDLFIYVVAADSLLQFSDEEIITEFSPSIAGSVNIAGMAEATIWVWTQLDTMAVPGDTLAFSFVSIPVSTLTERDTCWTQVVVGDVPVAAKSVNWKKSFDVRSYPNPFNPQATIIFSIPESGNVKLRIFDVQGRPLQTLANEWRTAGEHWVTWDGRDHQGSRLSTGVYFLRLESLGHVESRRIVLLR